MAVRLLRREPVAVLSIGALEDVLDVPTPDVAVVNYRVPHPRWYHFSSSMFDFLENGVSTRDVENVCDWKDLVEIRRCRRTLWSMTLQGLTFLEKKVAFFCTDHMGSFTCRKRLHMSVWNLLTNPQFFLSWCVFLVCALL